MRLTAFKALVAHDLHLFFSSKRFVFLLFTMALIQSLWLVFLSFVSPLALGDLSAVLSPFPLVLLLTIPSCALMTWRDESRNGSLCLVFSAVLPASLLALARLSALVATALLLSLVPLGALAALHTQVALQRGAFAAVVPALLWLSILISLASSFFSLLARKSPFSLFLPVLAALAAALLEGIWPRCAPFLPFHHWRAFMAGLLPLQPFSLLLFLSIVIVYLEGRMLAGLQRGGHC